MKNTSTKILVSFVSLLLLLVHSPAEAKGSKKAKLGKISKAMYEQRVDHASELLGRHYNRSVARTTESVKKIHNTIYKWTHDSLPKKHKKSYQKVAQTIIDEAHKYGFDPVFLMAVIQSESSFNPDCLGGVGEIGLMQIRPSTGKWMAEMIGMKWSGKKSLENPVTNVRLGAAYLNWLREKFDNHARLYLAAYNMGQTNVRKLLSKKVWPKEYPIHVMNNYVAYYSDLKLRLEASSKKPARGTLAKN